MWEPSKNMAQIFPHTKTLRLLGFILDQDWCWTVVTNIWLTKISNSELICKNKIETGDDVSIFYNGLWTCKLSYFYCRMKRFINAIFNRTAFFVAFSIHNWNFEPLCGFFRRNRSLDDRHCLCIQLKSGKNIKILFSCFLKAFHHSHYFGVFVLRFPLSFYWLKEWNGSECEATDLSWDFWPSQLQFYPGIYVALITLLTYPMSTCTVERSFSGMKILQTPLRKTMTDERLSSLAILHIRKHKDVFDIEGTISEFARLKGTHLALCLWRPWWRHCFTLFCRKQSVPY